MTIARAVWASFSATVLATAIVAAQATDIDVATDDAKLRATYTSPGKPGPGVLLFPQCNMDRRAWAGLAEALRARGIHTLAIDYRGMGDNRTLAADYAKRPADADAALAALAAMPGVDRARLAAGGASCGVDQAVALARRSGQIRALVLLSGAASESGLAYVQKAGLPVFFAFSTDEGGPLPKMDTDLSASPNRATTIRRLSNAGHGVPMFEREGTLLPELADWVAKTLR